MTFLELVDKFRRFESVEAQVLMDAPSIEIWDTAEICMKEKYEIDSEIRFRDPESDVFEIVSDDGVVWTDFGILFMIWQVKDIVEAVAKSRPDVDNVSLAKRIIEYRRNDA